MTEFTPIIRKRREKQALREGWIALGVRLIMIILIAILVFTKVFMLTQMSGQGMYPAIKDGDLLIVYRLQQDLQKEDVVVYEVDGEQSAGRIIAKEGDVVDIKADGTLIVNGTTQGGEINFLTLPRDGEDLTYRVPEDYIYVLGDYRTNTTDSRDFGALPMRAVKGKVITILRRRGL